MKRYREEQFLSQVLAIPSVNGIDDSSQLAWFLADYLKSCGVHAVVEQVAEKHANLIAVLEGSTPERVVWNGHLDTVPYGKRSAWSSDPEKPVKRNGCYYARGASDMKSGLAAMVYVLGQMKVTGHVPRQTICFLGTCDEEKGGLGAREMLCRGLMKDASLLLIGEPTGCNLGIAQKGCLWLELKVRGKTSHGAYPEEGVNAIEYAMRIAGDLRAEMNRHDHPLLGRATAQITMASGGMFPNMTPDEATVLIDIRTVPGIQPEDVLAWTEAVSNTYRDETNGELRVSWELKNQKKAIQTDRKDPWVRKLRGRLTTEFADRSYIGINYFTDGSTLTEECPDLPVILFGPGEAAMAHKADEYVEISKYLKYIRVLSGIF